MDVDDVDLMFLVIMFSFSVWLRVVVDVMIVWLVGLWFIDIMKDLLILSLWIGRCLRCLSEE